MSPMPPRVKRKYDPSKRREAAARTREAILSAALRLFCDRGYAATPMTAIAEQAGVALDTVYASAGRKPELARLLIETAISGSSKAVPAEERDYVRAIRAAPDAETKIAIYAAAMRMIAVLPRSGLGHLPTGRTGRAGASRAVARNRRAPGGATCTCSRPTSPRSPHCELT